MVVDKGEQLKQWLLDQVGEGRAFSSAREWSLRAGLNPNAVNDVMRRGAAGPDVLRKLARARGVSPGYVFKLAYGLEASDFTQLTEEQQELLSSFEQVPPHLRRAVLRLAQELSGGQEASTPS